jgi:hypothetical protein
MVVRRGVVFLRVLSVGTLTTWAAGGQGELLGQQLSEMLQWQLMNRFWDRTQVNLLLAHPQMDTMLDNLLLSRKR